jgi:hypothetical protein
MALRLSSRVLRFDSGEELFSAQEEYDDGVDTHIT